MRHIGNIADKKQAERFVHFLAAQHIEAALRPAQDTGYAVWVLEEDRVAAARQHLAAFLASPHDQWFDAAGVHQRRCTPAARGRLINVRTGFWRARRLATGSVTGFCIAISVVVTLLASLPAFAPLTAKLYFSVVSL